MIQRDFGMLIGPEAVCLSGRNSRLIVESLGRTCCKGPSGEEPILEFTSVLAERPCERLERLDAGAKGHARPVLEEPRRAGQRAITPEALEILLKEISPNGAQIDRHEISQPCPLGAPEILRALEEEPTRLGQHRRSARRTQRADLVAAGLVDRFAHELHHVEAVEHVQGVSTAVAHDVEERLPHVARHEPNGLGPLLAEHVEERVEALGLAVARNVQEAPAAMVELIDEREILVALFPAELVDADRPDPIEVAVLEAPTDCMLHGAEYGVPARPEAPGGLLPRQHPGPARQEPSVRVRRRRLARRPGDHLHDNAALPAVDPAHGVDQEHHDAPERHELERAGRKRVVARSLLTAAPTDRLRATARPDGHLKHLAGPPSAQRGATVDESWQRMNMAKDRLEAHRAGAAWRRNPYSRTMRFSGATARQSGASSSSCEADAWRGGRPRDAQRSISRRERRDRRRLRHATSCHAPTDPSEEPIFFRARCPQRSHGL